MLNKEQSLAVESDARILIVLAGPGSGKTRVIVEKLKFLTEKASVNPENILALTFTNKAANEIRERFSLNQNPFTTSQVWISTFHSLGLNLLRINQKRTPLKPNFILVDADDSKKLLRNITQELGLEYNSKELRELSNEVSSYRNGSAPISEEGSAIYNKYREKLVAINAIDYDDILILTLNLLKENADILEKYTERFAYLLIDEFQDTNLIQHEIVSLFLNKNKQTMLVGDVDQSIYGWRNARPEQMIALLRRAKVVHLTGNYRSTKNIVELCNTLIVNNKIPDRKPMFSVSNLAGEPVEFRLFRDSSNEVGKMVALLNERVGSKAILIRTNAMSREIEEELALRGIPYVLVGGTRFYERREIKDALAYIKFALNPFDSISFERIINTPKRKIGPKSVEKIQSFTNNTQKNLLASAKEVFASNSQALAFYDDIDQLSQLLDRSLVEGLKFIYNNIGLMEYYKTNQDQTLDNGSKNNRNERVENLEELLSAAKQFNERSIAYLDGIEQEYTSPRDYAIKFIENASINSSREEQTSGCVQIMTIHSAKGKEFDSVWIPALEETVIPHYLTDEEPDLEEERRLLFVACSRARGKLYLSATESRLKFGKLASNPISRFFNEIRLSLDIFDENQHFGERRWSREGKKFTPFHSTSKLSASEVESLSIGDKVEHPVFGGGVISALDSVYATIKFGDATKTVNLAIAPLKITR